MKDLECSMWSTNLFALDFEVLSWMVSQLFQTHVVMKNNGAIEVPR